MTRSDQTRVTALAVEIGNLAESVRLCVAHLDYRSANPEAMKRFHRTDADVAVWLDRLGDAYRRLEAARARVPTLAVEVRA